MTDNPDVVRLARVWHFSATASGRAGEGMRMPMFSPQSKYATRATRSTRSTPQTARALLWIPLLMGGVMTAVLVSRRSPLRRWALRLIAPPQLEGAGSVQSNTLSFARLRDAIVGNNKPAIARVFGTPHATAGGFLSGSYHQADVWYYPLDRIARSAMVIQFEDGIARAAELIGAPSAG